MMFVLLPFFALRRPLSTVHRPLHALEFCIGSQNFGRKEGQGHREDMVKVMLCLFTFRSALKDNSSTKVNAMQGDSIHQKHEPAILDLSRDLAGAIHSKVKNERAIDTFDNGTHRRSPDPPLQYSHFFLLPSSPHSLFSLFSPFPPPLSSSSSSPRPFVNITLL